MIVHCYGPNNGGISFLLSDLCAPDRHPTIPLCSDIFSLHTLSVYSCGAPNLNDDCTLHVCVCVCNWNVIGSHKSPYELKWPPAYFVLLTVFLLFLFFLSRHVIVVSIWLDWFALVSFLPQILVICGYCRC